MRTLLTKKATGYLATASLVICPFVSSVSVAKPLQAAFTTTLTTHADAGKSVSTSSSTRTIPGKTVTAPPVTTTKEQRPQTKQTIGRCWKRLMTMVREVTHAHRAKSK